MTDWIDISRPLSCATPPWPGDTAFDFRLHWRMAAGATVNVGAVNMGTHIGTHVDAPFHFLPAGKRVEALPLAVFVGMAVIIDVSGRPVISEADLAPSRDLIRDYPRVLLKTGAWLDPAVFPTQIPMLAEGVAGWLGQLGVILLGLDVPSVDAIDSASLPNHHALAAAGISILESLDLTGVGEGVCELIALPLKIVGGDASPVRAVLRYPSKTPQATASPRLAAHQALPSEHKVG